MSRLTAVLALAAGLAAPIAAATLPASPGSALAAFAQRHHVAPQDLLSLRRKGLGWGEIGIGLAAAEKADKPLSEVMEQRESGEGWGEICKGYGFHLKDVRQRAKAIAADGRAAERADRAARRASLPGGA